MLGDKGTRGGADATSGKLLWTISFIVTDLGPIVFGTPILLKHKADAMPANVPPPPLLPSSPGPVSKRPQCNHDRDIMNQMQALLLTGARHLDTLCGAQMVAQEA